MRSKPPEKDRSERYLLTYADLMNLLLILFIVLFCTSTQNVVKAAAVMNAIAKGFKTTTAVSTVSTSSSKSSTNVKSSSDSNDYSELFNDLTALLQQRGLLDKVNITASDGEVIISLKDDVLFASGKADLGTQPTSLISTMGGLINQVQFGQIFVEGFTDSDPIHTSEFQDNIALSSTRADNVERVLLQSGISSEKIVALGYGDTWPVAPNDTAADKAENRRVVLTILRKSVTPPDQTMDASELIKTLQDAAVGQTESSSVISTGSSSKSSSVASTAKSSSTASVSKSSSTASTAKSSSSVSAAKSSSSESKK